MNRTYGLTVACLCLICCLGSRQLRAETWQELLERADSLSKERAYDSALVIGQLALNHAREIFGATDTTVALLTHRMGVYYYEAGDYRRAETFFREELSIREKASGEDHVEVARVLNQLARLVEIQGRFAVADSLFRRALAIREKAFGPEHPEVAQTLNGLAILAMDQGKLAEAVYLLRKAVAMDEKLLGPEHPDLIPLLGNLAMIHCREGKYDEAGPLYERALAVQTKIHGEDHPDLAALLNNLAILYREQGRFDKVEPLYERALRLAEKLRGPDHPKVAIYVLNLGNAYLRQGKYAAAAEMLERAKAIKEKTHGPNHPSVAYGLIGLAGCYGQLGQYARAESLYQRALAIDQNAFGPDHPNVARDYKRLSRFYRRAGDYSRSLESARRALEVRRHNFLDNFRLLPEKDALTYSDYVRTSANEYISTLVAGGFGDQAALDELGTVILRTKGQVSDGIFTRQRRLVSEADPVVVALAEDYNQTRRDVAQLFAGGPAHDDFAEYRRRLDSMTTHAERLETELARASSSYREQRSYHAVDSRKLASALDEYTSMVEYIKYTNNDPDAGYAEEHYLVLVFGQAGVDMVRDLGEASPIDAMVSEYRRHLMHVASMSEPLSAEDDEMYREIASRLYEAIWAPIADQLDETALVLIAPDGALNLIPFSGLANPRGEYLTERYTIHYLSSGRDAVRLRHKDAAGRGLFVLGNPDYDATVADRVGAIGKLTLARLDGNSIPADTGNSRLRGARSDCKELNEITVDRLPGTAREVEVVSDLWREKLAEPVYVCLNTEATEDNFKRYCRGRRAIHLATHGFYTPATCLSEDTAEGAGPSSTFLKENPLLLSGLFLAGSNLHGRGIDSLDVDDGILTAYEVSMLDLEGVEWVVLSACESGLGEIESGEGVYGLRRAFLLAGSKTVISTLWPVSDRTTAELMAHLYEAVDRPLCDVFRDYQVRQIERLRSHHYSDHPVKWAAFIATGDWR